MGSAVPLPEDHHLTVIAETYRLLGDPTRLKVVLTCLDGPIAVGDIAKATGASQSLVSHHLRLLRAARLVRARATTSRFSTKLPTLTLPACWPT